MASAWSIIHFRMAKEETSGPIFGRTAPSVPGRPTGPAGTASTGSRTSRRRSRNASAARATWPSRRTVCTEPAGEGGADLGGQLAVDAAACRAGRVLSVMGLVSLVEDDAGGVVQCATPPVAEDPGHRPAPRRGRRRPGAVSARRNSNPKEGLIERVEPRARLHLPGGAGAATNPGRQCRPAGHHRQRRRAAVEADLIDRLLVTAEKGGVRPVICINKVDLVPRPTSSRWSGSAGCHWVLLMTKSPSLGMSHYHSPLRHEA